MKRFNITVNGVAYDVAVEEIEAGTAAPAVSAAPAAAVSNVSATPAPEAPVSEAPAQENVKGTELRCPMPGTVMSVEVNVGDKVEEAQVVVVLEAMKMENEIVAPCSGTIKAINVKQGDSVDSNDLLAVIA